MANKSKKVANEHPQRPAKSQRHQPGREHLMDPAPVFENPDFTGRGKLEGKESYVFLASSDANFMTGQILHPNGGETING